MQLEGGLGEGKVDKRRGGGKEGRDIPSLKNSLTIRNFVKVKRSDGIMETLGSLGPRNAREKGYSFT